MTELLSFDIHEQHERVTSGLRDLGFTEEDGIPSAVRVEQAVTPEIAGFLRDRADRGYVDDELIIAPSIQRVGLVGAVEHGKPGLVIRFDASQSSEPVDMTQFGFPYDRGDTTNGETVIAEGIWDKFDDSDPLHDNHHPEDWTVGVMLNGHIDTDPQDDSLLAQHNTDAGLVYRGLTAAQQRIALLQEVEELAELGLKLEPITIGQVIVANAVRRSIGLPMLDAKPEESGQENGAIRLVQYPEVTHTPHTYQITPSVWFGEPRNGKHLLLGGTPPQDKRLKIGVRRVLHMPIIS